MTAAAAQLALFEADPLEELLDSLDFHGHEDRLAALDGVDFLHTPPRVSRQLGGSPRPRTVLSSHEPRTSHRIGRLT